jgi:thiamine-phosphate pyrophosphorylase
VTRRSGPHLPWICLVTDHTLCDGGFAQLERAVAGALEGGVNVIQLREPSLPSRELYELGRRLRRLTGEANAALLVNDRLDVALAVGADGVHLREDSLPVAVSRDLAGDLLVGRSVHDVTEGVQAEKLGADYLIVGTIFPSASHPELAAAGPHLIRKIKARVKAPLLAIGGISAENAAQTIADGASGVAVMRAVLSDASPVHAARRLVESVQAAWPSAALHRGA